MSVTTFILGLLMLVSGVLMLKYNYQITNNFGSSATLDRYLGPGREYAFFKLLALLLIIIGFFTMFGLSDNLMNFLLSPLKGIFGGSEA